MIFILLGKLLGTIVGIAAVVFLPKFPVLVAAILGILPIWLELGLTQLTGVEPSTETRPVLRLADAIVDSLSFAVVPPIWLWLEYGGPGLGLAVGFFMGCALFRIVRFVRRGLAGGLYFEGLPVTYTGYLWPFCTYALEHEHIWFVEFTLTLFAVLMVWTRLKIKRTIIPDDCSRN